MARNQKDEGQSFNCQKRDIRRLDVVDCCELVGYLLTYRLTITMPSDRKSDNDESIEVSIIKLDERCEICYDDFEDLELGLQERIEIQPCRHAFCRKCLLEYFQYSISSKKIPIPCPMVGNQSNECSEPVSETVVEQILVPRATRDWNKFQRFQRLAEDPTLLSCPRCDQLVSRPQEPSLEVSQDATITTTTTTSPTVSCESCSHTFCAIHGDAHSSMTCSEYMQTQEAQQIQKSEESLRNWTKPCSHCGGFIYKHSGCDHVLCPACGHDMCFRCGTHHYLTGKVIRRCELCQQEFLDHRYNCQYRLRIMLSLPCLLPGMILYILGAILVALFTGFFGCCFGCGKWIRGKGDTESGFAPYRGIGRGLTIVFLPLLLLLNDFGMPMRCVDELLGAADVSSEIPVLSIRETMETNDLSE